MQLVKLIASEDDNAYNAGLDFASYIMQNCRSVHTHELLENDEDSINIVDRHNELEQWSILK